VGEGAAPPTALPALVVVAPLLFGLDGAGFIDSDFFINPKVRPVEKPSDYVSYIRHMI
jgi:hypothetical protein